MFSNSVISRLQNSREKFYREFFHHGEIRRVTELLMTSDYAYF